VDYNSVEDITGLSSFV